MSQKKALITGIRGQDGAYLAQYLLDQGYEVFGGDRRDSEQVNWRLVELNVHDRIKYCYFDLCELTNIMNVIKDIQPDEIYNLGAQSFVGTSFDQPLYTANVDALGALRILEAIRMFSPKSKFYQASTSEMFGKVRESRQSELTPFYPRSPYGFAKLFAHSATVNYRESYGLYCCSGILFNHESPLRGVEFVTRKITSHVAKIKYGLTDKIVLGNLDAKRDWGFAKDYVELMWKMLQQPEADDYVIATGETHTVRKFVEKSFAHVGYEIEWRGEGDEEKGFDKGSGKVLVEVSPDFYRPAEVDLLLGNPDKAKKLLGWQPRVCFDELVSMMVEADLKRVARDKQLGINI
ncbi:MAG: GDP-mannose 4,6-dehydratase [Oligoflexales bacterium]|nr:GDP-mannose 4,6-dehydratase [Oligoflexales bacterium]